MRFFLALSACFALAGCQSSTAPAPADAKPTEKPAPSTATAPPPAAVPEALKHDGFLYSGLGGPEKQTLVVKMAGMDNAESTTTIKLVEVKDGVATFERNRTGALAAVGNDVVRVDEKGVTVVSVSIGKMAAPALELPAKMDVGTTWQTESTIEMPNEKITLKGSNKVVGTEKFGDQMALKVTFSGTNASSKGQAKVVGTYWFVKNKGPVKTEMTQTLPGAQPQPFVLEMK